MTTARVAVELSGVHLGYRWPRRRLVLEAIDFTAQPGQITAVVGPNGVGKTTFFRALLGFLEPWSGTVRIAGLTPKRHREEHGTGYLPDVVSFPRGYKVSELLAEGAQLSGLRGEKAARAVDEALEAVDLVATRKDPLHTLSKGMSRRIALAFVLLGAPRVLLLDEPLNGLDAKARASLRETILRAKSHGTAVIVASHDLEVVQRIADVVYVLDRGRIQARIERSEMDGVDLEKLVLDAERIL
jgi:ABC-type multidrug transport system ATPase subunit